MTDTELKERLPVLRKALERFWAEWALEKGRPAAATGATMCRFTALFLEKMLGRPFEVMGGAPLFEGDAAGYFDGAQWHGHYWVTDGERIVDLTADQFGAEPVVLVRDPDVRYEANYTEEELEDALQHVRLRAGDWARRFRRQPPAGRA
jgi:hypothetical protein